LEGACAKRERRSPLDSWVLLYDRSPPRASTALPDRGDGPPERSQSLDEAKFTPAVVNGSDNAASILIADHGQFREFAAKVVDAVA
jgi:hypothetical protein